MHVLMINGSRNEKGCTYTALDIIASELRKEGIDSEILFVGKRTLDGGIDALVKEAIEKMRSADGLVLGSPVYFASATGEIVAFLDRFFWNGDDEIFTGKPGAVITSARRAGTSATLDVLNKYITYAQMPLVSSRYWNMVHGFTPEDVRNDKEGVQIMEVLAKNMIWMLKSIEAGKQAGVPQPSPVKKIHTSFMGIGR